MFEDKKILAIIPARGGSKGLPRKNIKPFLGKPLIAWTIEAALKSSYLDEVIVSTEDKEIAQISLQYGAKIPFMRPKELAKDDTPTIDVILHTLQELEKEGKTYDVVVLLQPTSPLRDKKDIDDAIKLFFETKALSLISVYEMPHPPFWVFRERNGFLEPYFKELFDKRRQELPKTYMPNGAIFIAYSDVLKQKKSFVTEKTAMFLMPLEKSVDIDSETDFKIAEYLLQTLK